MLISKYSQPDFNPFGIDGGDEDPGTWPAPTPGEPLHAVLSLPGSKSLTNRELILSVLAAEPSTLIDPLHSRDSQLMISALRALGADIAELPHSRSGCWGPDLRITPAPLHGSASIDCGLAGTVMRFVPPVAALTLGPTSFDGDEYARKRPMKAIVQGLRQLGVDITDDGSGRLPFTVHGTGSVQGDRIEIDASSSSQFVSGIALAAPRFAAGVHIRHVGATLPSIPHIEMTLDTLRQRGIDAQQTAPGQWHIPAGQIRGADRQIEPDLSNAAPFLAAAIVVGGSVSIRNWPEHTTQVGDQLRELLPRFGATVSSSDGTLSVTGTGHIRGVQLDLSEAGELAPTLIALAALADEPSKITGIGHIRHHETDRISALATELTKLGAQVTEHPDGISITPAPLHGGTWLSYSDHRMATSGALIGLRVPGVEVDDIATTAKTLPQFTELWQRMLSGNAEPSGFGSDSSAAAPDGGQPIDTSTLGLLGL